MEGIRLDTVSDTLRVYQKPGVFSYGTDAVLLSRYALRHIGASKPYRVCDLCSGTGIVGLMLCDARPQLLATCVEIGEDAAELSRLSASESGLDCRVTVHTADLRRIGQYAAPESFDFVTCNPPYMSVGCGKMCADDAITAARHEVYGTMFDVMRAAAYLLPTGGNAFFVYRTERLETLFAAAASAKLAIKELMFIKTKPGSNECRLVLCRAVKGASEGMKTHVCSPSDFLLMETK